MRRTAALSWITLTAWIGPALAGQGAPDADCRLKQYASVDLTIDHEGAYVPVTVENTSALMALAIQSGMTVMWADTARELHLPRHSIPSNRSVYYGKSQIDQYAAAHTFKIGSMPVKNAQFLIGPAPDTFSRIINGVPVIGALGMDYFLKVDFELDFNHRHLNLFSQDHCAGEVVYWTDTYASTPIERGPLGNVYFPMELEGQKIQATVRPNQALTTLSTDVTKRLYGFDEHSADIETVRDSKGTVQSQYRAMALTAPGLRVTNPKVKLSPRADNCTLQTHPVAQYIDCTGEEAPLHLGMSILQEMRLYFATKENVLYFTAADAQPPSASTATTPTTP